MLSGMINTVGAEEGKRNESPRMSLTTLAAQIRDLKFGFVEAEKFNKSAILPQEEKQDSDEVLFLDYLDKARHELERLAEDQFASAQALIPKTDGEPEQGGTSDTESATPDPWRDRTNKLIDKLIAGSELYSHLARGSGQLPKIIYGDGVVVHGRLEGTKTYLLKRPLRIRYA